MNLRKAIRHPTIVTGGPTTSQQLKRFTKEVKPEQTCQQAHRCGITIHQVMLQPRPSMDRRSIGASLVGLLI